VLGGSSENAQRQYAGDEEDLLLQYAIRQSLDTDTTASEQVHNLPFCILSNRVVYPDSLNPSPYRIFAYSGFGTRLRFW
jgi:hypothetical protein